MKLTVEIEREDDGRWMAGVAEVPGASAYGETQEQAAHKAIAIAFVEFALDEGERSGAMRLAQVRTRVRELQAEGVLSAEHSQRMLHYMRRDVPDLVMQAWLANPVGPIPWRPPYRLHPDDEADLVAAGADTRSVTLTEEELEELANGEWPESIDARFAALECEKLPG